jgi:hypothetical protein
MALFPVGIRGLRVLAGMSADDGRKRMAYGDGTKLSETSPGLLLRMQGTEVQVGLRIRVEGNGLNASSVA